MVTMLNLASADLTKVVTFSVNREVAAQSSNLPHFEAFNSIHAFFLSNQIAIRNGQ